MRRPRSLAAIKPSRKARRRLFIILIGIFVVVLSRASFREFRTISSGVSDLRTVAGSVGKDVEVFDTKVVEEDAYEEAYEDTYEDELDYYGGENTRMEENRKIDMREKAAGSQQLVGDTDTGKAGRDNDPDSEPSSKGRVDNYDVKGKPKEKVGKNEVPVETKEMNKASLDSLHNESPTFTVIEHADYQGDALVWGTSNLVETAEECSRACSEYKPATPNHPSCNLWVYCGDEELCLPSGAYMQCWLKYVRHPDGARASSEGPTVGWTSGIASSVKSLKEREEALSSSASSDRSYHVIISAQGEATHWQSRLHYYWYLKTRKQCQEQAAADGTTCDMGGFTRLLHDDKPDDLMDEIPTFVAKTLPKEHPNHGYIVLNRPYAFLQWVQQATIQEKYVLMGEPDHIWLKPLPNPMIGNAPAAYPFFYIEPAVEKYINITERFVGKLDTMEKKAQLYPIGSSPTIMALEDMKQVVPIWYDLSLKVHEDDDAVEAWGWVQEMYAFSMAMYNAGLREIILIPDMMGQPPWDRDKNRYTLLHYTYGMDYTLDGVFTPGKVGEWHWDKRDFHLPIPRGIKGPPEGTQNELVKELIARLNEATDAIPMWDVFAKTGRVAPEMVWSDKVIDGTPIAEQ